MLSQEDLEIEREEARLRVQRDEKSRLESAFEEGRQQGLQQALKERVLSLILRQLIKLFGNLDTIVQNEIRSLSLLQLEQLGEDLMDFDFGKSNELLKWLSDNRRNYKLDAE